jgi:hypothetical protein
MLGFLPKAVFLPAASAAAFLLVLAQVDAGSPGVDLALVLAVDVSSSMTETEQQAQRDGYIRAFRSPEIRAAIESGARGRIAVAYLEWAGPDHQRALIPWRILDGPAAVAYAAELERHPLVAGKGTSISSGLAAAGNLLVSVEVPADRWVIDLSGDGPNNVGGDVVPVRDRLVASGIVINGLAISLRRTGLAEAGDAFGPGYVEAYLDACVVGGPGAFVVSVNKAEDFADAIMRKLVLEIAGLPPRKMLAGYRPAMRSAFDCGTFGQMPGR